MSDRSALGGPEPSERAVDEFMRVYWPTRDLEAYRTEIMEPPRTIPRTPWHVKHRRAPASRRTDDVSRPGRYLVSSTALEATPDSRGGLFVVGGSMTDWLTTGAGQPVKCPHCSYRLLDTGEQTLGRVCKSKDEFTGHHVPIPPGGSIVHCKGCRQFYLYWPQSVSSAA